MRRLEELLTHAADRGDRMGPDRLIEHLQRRLEGEREVVVAGSTRRGLMVTTKERPTTSEIPERPRKRWALALTAFAVVAGAVAIVAIVLGTSGNEEVTEAEAIELAEGFATNLRNGDIDALIVGGPVDGDFNRPFVEWHVGLQTNPQFTDCRVAQQSIDGSGVVCNVAYSPDSFFVRPLGSTTNTVAVLVTPDGLVSLEGWLLPAGLSGVAEDFRLFLEAEHPDLVDTVFGPGGYAGFAFSREAGETIDQYQAEFLQHRAIGIAQQFAEDFRNADIAALEATSQNGTTDAPFVEWHHGLQANPELTDCRITRDTVNGFVVACDVQFDPDSLFPRAGSPSSSVSLDISPDGLVGAHQLAAPGQPDGDWPGPPGLLRSPVSGAPRHDRWDRLRRTGMDPRSRQVIDEHLDEFVAYTESQG